MVPWIQIFFWNNVLCRPWCIGNTENFCRNFFLSNLSYWVKKNLHNILPKFGACRLQLINLTFFNAFPIRSEVFEFSWVCLIIVKVLGFSRLKVEIKGKIFFFSCSFTFLDSFWSIFKAFFIPAFIIPYSKSVSLYVYFAQLELELGAVHMRWAGPATWAGSARWSDFHPAFKWNFLSHCKKLVASP